ncbi:hypothetical protein A3Q56_02790 [Intoshia linei]|uniref:DDE-1 domain-containing protein n=1 Tax=Intoshia linei TaxID=1819745 RepID=A0A177B5C3_9BILA|nr:hypothetical protein A3Q56_02790 [Intoshia linei]
MTVMIFCDWVITFDKKMTSENRKVLLFVNNGLSHSSAYFNEKLNLKNTKLHFLPKNTANLTQPLDAGITKYVKQYYRKSIVKYLLTHMNINDEKNLKHINLIDSMNIISRCLKNVKEKTIIDCFQKCGFIQCQVDTDPIADSVDHEEKINLSMYREFQAKTHCKLTYLEYIQYDDELSKINIDQYVCELFTENNNKDGIETLIDINKLTMRTKYCNEFYRELTKMKNVPQEIFDQFATVSDFYIHHD